MTREEASFILRKFYADGYKSNNYNVLEQALQLAVMCLENLPHWISVEFPHWISVCDELPKGFAIITNGDDVLVGKYNFEKGLWGVRNKTMFAYTLLPANWKVTHWMPLPSVEYLRETTKMIEKGGEE